LFTSDGIPYSKNKVFDRPKRPPGSPDSGIPISPGRLGLEYDEEI